MDDLSTSRPATTPTASDAGALAVAYLRAVEDRDLARAQAFLAPGTRLTFPGGVIYVSLDDQVFRRAQPARKGFSLYALSIRRNLQLSRASARDVRGRATVRTADPRC